MSSDEARPLSPNAAEFRTLKRAPAYGATGASGGTAFPLKGAEGIVGAIWVSNDGEEAGFLAAGQSLEQRRSGLAIQRELVRSFQQGVRAGVAVQAILRSVPNNVEDAIAFRSLSELRARFIVSDRTMDLD